MSSILSHRFSRPIAFFVCGALVLAGCGGSESSDSDSSRTRNAGLAVSDVALQPATVASIAGGLYHSLVIDDAGNLYGLGSNGGGQLSVPALKNGGTRFTSAAAGSWHSLAIDDAGNMYAFGQKGYGQVSVPALKDGGTRFTSVAAGYFHSLAIDDAGNMYAFGSNGYEQLSVPALKDGGTRFTSVAAGSYHSLAIDDAGNLYAFGSNGHEQASVPALKDGGTRFTSVAAGHHHSLAIDDAGNLYGFGSNGYEQLSLPALKNGASEFTTVAAGVWHSLVLDDTGNMYAFGGNWFGQGTLPPSLETVNLRTMPIAMGGAEALALDEQGIARYLTYSWSPSEKELLSIATSARHGLGITRSGTVVGWGDNSVGQLNIPDIRGVLQVVAGYSYSAALRFDGRVIEWGSHTAPAGQLIDKPADLEQVVSLTGGLTHILGITSEGTVVGWGDNTDGKASPPDGLKDVVAVAANSRCSVAATNEGELSWWGSCPEMFTQKSSLSNVTAIALTDSNAVAIVDGALVIWGMKEDYSAVLEEDITIAKTDSAISAISAGNDAFLAVDQNGNVTSWGSNWGNTITIPESFGGPVPVVSDNICEDCEQPEGFTDDQIDVEMLPFFIEVLTPEQKAKVIGALGGSTTKPLTPEEIQALIDAAKKEGRTEALTTVREAVVAGNTTAVDPATTTAATLPSSQSPMIKVNTAITTKRAVTLLGLKKVTKVAFVVPKKASVPACAVTKTQVTATAAGVCNVKVTYTDAKKKRRTTTLTLVVG